MLVSGCSRFAFSALINQLQRFDTPVLAVVFKIEMAGISDHFLKRAYQPACPGGIRIIERSIFDINHQYIQKWALGLTA